ncbi:MAG: hypothetical protein CVU84_11005 [Firmicutes bacterium HGW-Firmicutes-1]|nr:MAG: hypothetical protein CVU84_11005 [Firmicutes bacterium HGW-Firmicutes-1]
MSVNGSFTVEASMIFPIISLILIVVLSIAIYTHEMACMQSIANGAQNEVQCFCESTEYEDRLERGLYIDANFEDRLVQHINSYVKDRAEKTLIMTNKERLAIEVEVTPFMVYKKIDLSISKGFTTPFRFNYMIGLLKIDVHSSSKLLQPANTIRMVDVMDDLTNDITATKALKERYEEILNKIEESINEWI